MKKYTYLMAAGLMVASGALFAADTQRGEAVVQKMIREMGENGVWDPIFQAIDRYSIDPATLVVGKYTIGYIKDKEIRKDVGILYLVINQARKYAAYTGEDSVNPEPSRMEAKKALKILAEKYGVFKDGKCGIDDCNTLFEVALSSDTWHSDEPIQPSLDVVDLLLKYGAKPNRKTMANIKKARADTWYTYMGK